MHSVNFVTKHNTQKENKPLLHKLLLCCGWKHGYPPPVISTHLLGLLKGPIFTECLVAWVAIDKPVICTANCSFLWFFNTKKPLLQNWTLTCISMVWFNWCYACPVYGLVIPVKLTWKEIVSALIFMCRSVNSNGFNGLIHSCANGSEALAVVGNLSFNPYNTEMRQQLSSCDINTCCRVLITS